MYFIQSQGVRKAIVVINEFINAKKTEINMLLLFADGATVQTVELKNLGNNVKISKIGAGFEILSVNQTIRIHIRALVSEITPNLKFYQISRELKSEHIATDCVALNASRMNWYGGPAQSQQYWPIEKLQFNDYPYFSRRPDHCSVAERYWLNSEGSFIYVDENTPLFLNQNKDEICFTAKNTVPYYNGNRTTFTFEYYIGVGKDARNAHLHAVHHFLRKPTGHPDGRMVEHPVWSTWTRFKKNVTEEKVVNFANEIEANRFNHSQIEIDDNWEDCYGSLTFNPEKFPNITKVIGSLKRRGFRTTLWIHPFINKNCAIYSEAKANG